MKKKTPEEPLVYVQRITRELRECREKLAELEDEQRWRPMTEVPTDIKPAYLLARQYEDEADWYYHSVYWCRYSDLLDDNDESIERFMDGEYGWFVFYGEEPHPFDASSYTFWRKIYPAPQEEPTP